MAHMLIKNFTNAVDIIRLIFFLINKEKCLKGLNKQKYKWKIF